MAIGGDFTRRLLLDAGLGPGMGVLDVGCGSGDVALIAAELVDASGAEVDVAREAGPLENARRHVGDAGFPNVTFELADLSDLPDLGRFDAVVGRRVLMYQPDRADAVRHLTACLQPGRLVAFHEDGLAASALRQNQTTTSNTRLT